MDKSGPRSGTTVAISALCLAILAGCSGNGEGLDENGRPLGESPAFSGPVLPELNSLQERVFTPTCAVSGCHTGTSAPLGLRLDAASIVAALINQPSSEQPDVLRVAPGDPDNSYLVHKVEGTAAVGARMPRNQPPLPAATIQAIRDWIAAGALVESAQ